MPDAREVTDLRLVPAALASWAACTVAVGFDARAVVLASAALTLIGVVALRLVRPGARAAAALVLIAVLAVLTGCAAQLHSRDAGLLSLLAGDRAAVVVVGVVRAEVEPAQTPWSQEPERQRYRTVLSVEQISGRGRSGTAAAGVLVLGDQQWRDVPYGTRVRVSGRLGPADRGEALRGILLAWGEIETVDQAGPVDRHVTALRSALLRATDGLSPDARGLVPGAAIGDTSRVPADLEQAMRDVSLTHVTAVSGGHFAVLAVTVLGLTALMRLPRPVRAMATGTVMAGFVLLVHPEPSVVRAAAMGALVVLGLVAGRPSRAVPALAASVVALLLLDPWLGRSVGFVLSVLATGAILLLAPALATRFERLVPRRVALMFAVPVAAQAVCAPVVLLLDPALSTYAVPANLLAAPALVPATLLGVGATLAAPWWPGLAGVLVHGAAVGTWWIATVARLFADLPGARSPWPAGPGGAALLAVLTTAVLALVLGAPLLSAARRRPMLVAALCLTLVLTPGFRGRLLNVLPGGWPPPSWRLVMCDVGQGDALVVRTGPGSGVLIDVGPDGGAADRCLDDLGIDRIDLLVLTHHHADHVGGLERVVAGREVRAALVSPLAQPAGQAARTVAALDAAGVRVQVAGTGDMGVVGDLRWSVLWPRADVPGSASAAGAGLADAEVNDWSVVMLLEAPELSVLALGDVEPAAQERIAAALPSAALGADVVKVAHHGSAHQSERLAQLVRPDVALIGAGADNTYGHPAPATVGMFHELGALVLSTDRCGPVAVARESGGVDVGGVGGALRVTARCLG